jgi:riboflavin kinase/FMN adenylyltransferase
MIDVLSGPHTGSYLGAASLGVKPTFGLNTPCLESFLFDFEGDLYDEQLSVAFVDHMRGEEKFDDLDALITQMHTDCDKARLILSEKL